MEDGGVEKTLGGVPGLSGEQTFDQWLGNHIHIFKGEETFSVIIF